MKLSIVTACFNSAATIEDTLRSVAAQRGVEIEHIVVDGGSTDGTMAIVRRFPHVAVAISEPDRGLYDAMNKGLARATGDAIGFLNSDDFFCRPDAAARIAAALDGADIAFADVALVDQHDVRRMRRLYRVRGYRPWMLRIGHMPPHPTLYARRRVFDRVGGFDPRYRIAGDFDFAVRALLKERIPFRTVEATLVGFRFGGVSTRNVGATMTINREIAASLRANGCAMPRWALFLRYPWKALQYLSRPQDYGGRFWTTEPAQ